MLLFLIRAVQLAVLIQSNLKDYTVDAPVKTVSAKDFVLNKEVVMKHWLTYVSILFGATLGTSAHANTVNQEEIDRVVNQLSRQHNSASNLVRAAREPASLALNSPLVSQSTPQNNKDGDVLSQLTAVASNTVSKFTQSGLASWYGRQFHGRKTASGERFDMNAMTAAHRSLPMNCYVRVTNQDNGKSVVVRINDRGPFHGNRVLDLSYGAAQALGITQRGVGNVTIERVSGP